MPEEIPVHSSVTSAHWTGFEHTGMPAYKDSCHEQETEQNPKVEKGTRANESR
jgi:hypothetical protein